MTDIIVRDELALPAFAIAGLSIRTSHAHAANAIPALWQRVMAADLPRALARWTAPLAITGDEIPLIALYDRYQSDHTGPYDLTVGVPVRDDAGAIEGLVVRAVPAQRYARVEAIGPTGVAVFAAWQRVWAELTPRRAFTSDLEVYRPSRADRVELAIALR